MGEEYLDERERDLLDFLRNNLEDPITDRGTDVVEEEHIATVDQTEFTLENTLVKNVADSISLNATTLFKGYDYYVEYGEGKAITKVILNTAAEVGDVLKISYHYGDSWIEREYSRTDAKLPRIVMMFLTGEEDFAGLGDALEFGKGSYFNAAYRFEIRDRYANRARRLSSQLQNLIKKMRHANLFRTNITRSGGVQNFDYDRDKEAYLWQFTADIQWEIRFE